LEWQSSEIKCQFLSLLDSHNIIHFKFIGHGHGHGPVSRAGDHRRHRGILLHKIFRTYRVIEALSYVNIAEFDTV
jgi:hypothetical protein